MGVWEESIRHKSYSFSSAGGCRALPLLEFAPLVCSLCGRRIHTELPPSGRFAFARQSRRRSLTLCDKLQRHAITKWQRELGIISSVTIRKVSSISAKPMSSFKEKKQKDIISLYAMTCSVAEGKPGKFLVQSQPSSAEDLLAQFKGFSSQVTLVTLVSGL